MPDSKKYIDFIEEVNDAGTFVLHSCRGLGNAWRVKGESLPDGEGFK